MIVVARLSYFSSRSSGVSLETDKLGCIAYCVFFSRSRAGETGGVGREEETDSIDAPGQMVTRVGGNTWRRCRSYGSRSTEKCVAKNTRRTTTGVRDGESGVNYKV